MPVRETTTLREKVQMRNMSAWESSENVDWDRDLLQIFVRNQMRVFLATPMLALIFAFVGLLYTTPLNVGAWLISCIGCQGIQLYLCKTYLNNERKDFRMTEWIGMLAASEFLIGACWSIPLFVFWESTSPLQHMFLIASLMAVIAVRIMIAANFMPVVIAGTGFMTFNVAIRCILEGDTLSVALGAMAIALEIFFIQLAQRLQEISRDMLIFKAQKERLIEELRVEKEKAEEARVKAEEANRAKSTFLATMSHELRTPLNAILGFSEILSHEMFGPHKVEAYKNYAHDIHSSGHYLLNLINDILDLSRIEAGRQEMQEEPIDLQKSVDEALHVVELRAQQKQQSVIAQIEAGLPKLLADRRSVQQMWLNLLSNAIKFTPEGGKIEAKAFRGPAGSLCISVRDNGPGIPSRELEAAMGAFSRGSLATTKAIDGAGLGLPIVKGLITLHDGDMRIHSAPGLGTEVVVSFPSRRVLDGPRGEVMSAPGVKTTSQRKLIALTG
jgi:two-component system cell cycle sensor histidine kinase PleC